MSVTQVTELSPELRRKGTRMYCSGAGLSVTGCCDIGITRRTATGYGLGSMALMAL